VEPSGTCCNVNVRPEPAGTLCPDGDLESDVGDRHSNMVGVGQRFLSAVRTGRCDSPPRLRRGRHGRSQCRGGANRYCDNPQPSVSSCFIPQTSPVPLRGTSPPGLMSGAWRMSELQGQRSLSPHWRTEIAGPRLWNSRSVDLRNFRSLPFLENHELVCL
jgi:hypothetical protein